jgi:uncharacterized protein YqgC (DUF456 family)
MEILLTILAGTLMLVGLLAIFLPFVPDILLIWVAALGYGLLVGWGESGPWMFAAITILGVLGGVSEAWVSGAGARKAGASLRSIVVGIIAGGIGFFFFPPLGMIVGLLGGTFLVEFLRLNDAQQAARATLGMGLGFGVSFGVKLLFGLMMIGAWIVWVLLG